MTRFHARPIAAFCLAFGIIGSPAAWAQTSAPDEQPQPSSHDGDHVILGAGVGYTPAYQGSEDYRARPIPAVDIKWGPFFANLRNGVGINVIDTGAVTIGGSVTYMQGYRSRDAPDGIGKLADGVGGRAFANLKAGGLIATIGADTQLSGGTRGVVADASLAFPMPLSHRLVVIPSIATSWADRKYNDRYFGIDRAQSIASVLSAFDAGSGFKDASFILIANYRLSDHLLLTAAGGVTTLLGEVQDSPLVAHKTQPSGLLSLSYRFGPKARER